MRGRTEFSRQEFPADGWLRAMALFEILDAGSRFAKFCANNDGNIAILFGIALVPMLSFVGARLTIRRDGQPPEDPVRQHQGRRHCHLHDACQHQWRSDLDRSAVLRQRCGQIDLRDLREPNQEGLRGNRHVTAQTTHREIMRSSNGENARPMRRVYYCACQLLWEWALSLETKLSPILTKVSVCRLDYGRHRLFGLASWQ
jgi:hypothetical protein